MNENAEPLNSASPSILSGLADQTLQQSDQQAVKALAWASQLDATEEEILRQLATEAGYTLSRRIGRGTYGEVWQAQDKTSVDVAIKFLTRGTREQWKELHDEAKKLSLLSNVTGIVHLRDIELETHPPYIVMEYASGGSIESHLKTRRAADGNPPGPMTGPAGSQPPASASAESGSDTSDYKGSRKPYGVIPVTEALDLFEQIVNALALVHAKGIIHCDLKPANVLLDEHQKPMLADFGQSSLTDNSKPRLGTFFYMAPEQADIDRVEVDTRYDVYALGAIFYVMVTGRPPRYDSALVDDLHQTKTLDHRLDRYRNFLINAPGPAGHRGLPGMDTTLADLISACLRVEPHKRPASAAVIQSELQRRRQRIKQRPLLLFAMWAPLVMIALMYGILKEMGRRLEESSSKEIRQAMSEQVHFPNQYLADQAAQGIAERIAKTYAKFITLAKHPVLHQNLAEIHNQYAGIRLTEMLPTEACNKLKGILKAHPQPLDQLKLLLKSYDDEQEKTLKFYSFGILTPEGIGLTNYNGKFKKEMEGTVFTNFSWRDYVNGTGDIQKDIGINRWFDSLRRPHLSQPFITTKEFDNSAELPFISMTHPIMVNDKLVGFLQASIYMDELTQWLKTMNMPGQRIAIYNGQGHCLFHDVEHIQKAFSQNIAKPMYDPLNLDVEQGDDTFVDPLDGRSNWAAFSFCKLPSPAEQLMQSETGRLTVIAEIDQEKTVNGLSGFLKNLQGYSLSILIFFGVLLSVMFGWLLWHLKRKERLIRG